MGLLGSVGTLLLFEALRDGPAYIIVPIASLYPVVTVVLAATHLKERTGKWAVFGIALALAAILLLSLQTPGQSPVHGWVWLAWSLLALVMFGVQGWLIKASAKALTEESVFFYMATAAAALVPVAVWTTDFSRPVNWGLSGPWLTAAIQLPNAVAALLTIYAYREGKVIIVGPIVGLYPLVTIVLSLIVYQRVPDMKTLAGMVLALLAIALMAVGEAAGEHTKSASDGSVGSVGSIGSVRSEAESRTKELV
jgi:drug/metabolite transporter (DMT)-like permease